LDGFERPLKGGKREKKGRKGRENGRDAPAAPTRNKFQVMASV